VHDEGDDFEALGQFLRRLRGDKAQAAVAKRLGVNVAAVCRAEQGKALSARTAARYDAFYSARGAVAEGEIIAWRDGAERARKRGGACRHGDLAALAQAGGGYVVVAPLPGAGTPPGPPCPELAAGTFPVLASPGQPAAEGVSPSNRRNVFQAVGAPLVAGVLGEVEEASRAITAGRPDPWTLGELADDAVTIAARYWSTPLDQLLPEVVRRWRQCRDMLKQSLIGKTCEQVIQLAGTYAYYAARIGYHTGDRQLASGFATLAEQYAEISEDPLLINSVAGLRSCAAFDVAQFTEAADIAGQAVGQAHPYCRARLYAYQARALAASGHPDNARDALTEMRAHMVDLPRMPGAGVFSEAIEVIYLATVLADIGDRSAEAFAREAIAGTPANDHQAVGMAYTALGKALTRRDPGAAADAGLRALDANSSWPSVGVENGIRGLCHTLSRRHGGIAEVVRLEQACRKFRPAVAT
jgi:hypothetical protein